MDVFQDLLLGWQVATTASALLYCLVGVTIGMLVGVVPGIGVLAAISLLLPLTFGMEEVHAIIMLSGIYYGTRYGGSTASILLNLPGDTASAITCLDGYPMAQNGKAALALFLTAIASFFGAVFGFVILVLGGTQIANYALKFGPAEYCALMTLGLVSASTMSAGSLPKALAMVFMGLTLGLVGTDLTTGTPRFNFGLFSLSDGISLIVLAMGMFGLSEVISSAKSAGVSKKSSLNVTFASMIPSWQETKDSFMPAVRGSAIGSFFGALPGTGSTIASFVAYAVESKISRTKERFGRGAIEGVVAPEASNNAAIQTAFIPTLTLGIPGDAVMALILGALIINGITPGPLLIQQQPGLFWGLIVSLVIGNLILLVLNIPLIRIWIALLLIPYRVLFPFIVICVAIGAYSASNNVADIYFVAFFGVMGYLAGFLHFQTAPLILGFVLGPLLEQNLRRALLLSGGDYMVFFERPISAVLLSVTGLMLLSAISLRLWSVYKNIRKARVKSGNVNSSYKL